MAGWWVIGDLAEKLDLIGLIDVREDLADQEPMMLTELGVERLPQFRQPCPHAGLGQLG